MVGGGIGLGGFSKTGVRRIDIILSIMSEKDDTYHHFVVVRWLLRTLHLWETFSNVNITFKFLTNTFK